MKNRSIKTLILVPVLAVLVIGILVQVLVLGVQASSTANDLSDQIVSETVYHYEAVFDAIGAESYATAASLAPVVGGMAGKADGREEALKALGEVLDTNKELVSVWTVWEKNAFDGNDARYANAPAHDQTGQFAVFLTHNGAQVQAKPMVSLGYDDPAQADFYQGAKRTKKIYATDPYYFDEGKEKILVYSLSAPILRNGEMVGAVGVTIDMTRAIEELNKGKILKDGYLFTLSPGGLIATHNNLDLLLTNYKDTWVGDFDSQLQQIYKGGGNLNEKAYSDRLNQNVIFSASAVKIGQMDTYWIVCGVVPQKTVAAPAIFMIVIIGAIGVVLIAVVGLTIFFIVRKQLAGLPKITAVAEQLATGDVMGAQLDPVVIGPTKNEVKLLNRAFSAMVENTKEQVQALQTVAGGDFSIKVDPHSAQDVLNVALQNMVKANNQMMNEIKVTADQVFAGAQQIAQASQNLATGSTEQAATIEELNASATQIQEMARDNKQEALTALDEIDQAGVLMEQSMQAMNEMIDAMHNIDEKSQNITKVIKVIDDIAFQTNILALNAAVEAARAGSHGKGFAVVADEVRNLASKSAEAAKETAELITQSSQSVAQGNSIVGVVNESLDGVSKLAQSNAESIKKINEASDNQVGAMDELVAGTSQISTVVQDNSATSEQTAASAEEMSAQAEMLKQIVARYKLSKEEEYSGPPPESNGFSLPGEQDLPSDADDKY